MFNLIRLTEQVEKAKKQRDDWKMNGYDTPYLTYHEQLDLYQARVDKLMLSLKKAIKE